MPLLTEQWCAIVEDRASLLRFVSLSTSVQGRL
jgi:hypothetical protein